MKINKLLPKFVATCCLTVSFLGLSNVQAQSIIPASTADITAAPGPGVGDVLNTGTDSYDDNGNILQLMVWDGPTPTLSWELQGSGNPSASIPLDDPQAQDPDVVMAYDKNSGVLSAMVVYIDGNKQVRYDGYDWNGNDFVPNGISGNLGTSGICSYPNIDANKFGHLAVVWQETFVETVQVTISSPTYGLSSYSQNVTWAQVHSAYGDMQGNGPNGQISGYTNPSGDLVAKNIRFAEQNREPDVAVGNFGGDHYVTFTYIRRSVDPLNSRFEEKLIAQHEEWWKPITAANTEILATSDYLSKPRIAASAEITPFNDYDYEVVVGYNPTNCEMICQGTKLYEIWNIGRYNGVNHNKMIVNNHFTSSLNIDPVVTYVGGPVGPHDGVYVVSWTSSQDKKDILARTFAAGNYYSNDYSVVNQNTGGDQQIPSIAGRFLSKDFGVGYMFHNLDQDLIAYKYSDQRAGIDPLRSKPKTSTSSTVYPNPFSKVVNFNYTIEKGETPSEILIYNATGVVVDRVPVTKKEPGNYIQTIQLKNNAPEGMYLLKLNTSLKSETIRATKIN